MYKRILVPFDGGEPSQRALHEALEVAKDGGAKLHVLHIVDEFLVGGSPDASYISTWYYADAIAALQASGKQILQQAEEIARSTGIEPELTLWKRSARASRITSCNKQRIGKPISS
jgi:nucleotide-binding universal stress UspA family protein